MLTGAVMGAGHVAPFYCGNRSLFRRLRRRAGSGIGVCPVSDLAVRVARFERNVDILEDVARSDGNHAVGFDEVVAAFTVLLATERVDEAERRTEDARADGEARAISLPVTGRLSWIFSGDFLIGFRSRRFWSRCS